ncbi:hypothetical protein [Allosphingosinicella sp.]|uniref:hypothetical protein n=1 Tax=Allosphingosinicella sp. TaxID=2823234 RepID=UPI002EFCC374
MLGQSIASRALADAGLRRLATEQFGPRPAGTRTDRTSGETIEARTIRPTRP